MNLLPLDPIDWKWYTSGKCPVYTGAWVVVNRATGRFARVSSESATLKVIELGYALRMGEDKPLNHKTLEQKAKYIEGIPMRAEHFWTWNGKPLAYETDAHDVSLIVNSKGE